jgi:hypothetical protein
MDSFGDLMTRSLNFQPTWLMIKRHKETGLMYFCKTTSADPVKYNGSGTYWKNHRKIHGDNIENVWSELFNEKENLVEFATFFSVEMDIVKSNSWANLIPENGLQGGTVKGHITKEGKERLRLKELGRKWNHTDKTKNKMSEIRKNLPDEIRCANKGRIFSIEEKISRSGKKDSPETLEKKRISHLGKTHTEESKLKMSKAKKEGYAKRKLAKDNEIWD